MTFEEIIPYLKQGGSISRVAWGIRRDRTNLAAPDLHFTREDIFADDWLVFPAPTASCDQAIRCPVCKALIEIKTKA